MSNYERYDYYKEVREDIVQFLRYEWTLVTNEDSTLCAENNGETYELDTDNARWVSLSNPYFWDRLYEDLWVCDSVTGNASGSYFMNSFKAQQALLGNLDLLADACEEFGSDIDILKNGAEACDVSIRCYVLGYVLDEAIEEWIDENTNERGAE